MSSGAPIALPVEGFLAKAREMTGIDIEDPEAAAPLAAWLRSLNEESQLLESGARAMEARILRLLANRLRMQRDFARHPEIAEERIEAPIFLCGMGRTGSTKAHRLLAASGDFNWNPYWQVFNPSLLTGDRVESPAPRIAEAEAYARWFDAESPDLVYAHPFEPHEPEEESLILEHSLRTPVMLGWSPIPSYLAWLSTQDMTAQFAYLRDALKYLQWQGRARGDRRWVLKSPLYTGLERPLLAVFPDARLVMTHRDPVPTIASGLRLLELFYRPFTAAPVEPGPYATGQAAAVAAHLANRKGPPGLDLLDVGFAELTGSCGPVVERIYDFVGLALSDEARRRMLGWNERNPQHKKGRFVYALADFGLGEAEIVRMFAPYVDFLEATFGRPRTRI